MSGHRKGFTLVELSIVLVIIGLLIGGVLKGQAMIENAKVKNFVSDVDGLVAAAYGYQDKLNKFPGDTGDGLIKVADDEDVAFYQDIITEGFISGDATQTTLETIAKETPFGAQYKVVASTTVGKAPHNAQKNAIETTAGIDPKIAGTIDTKYDDGDPIAGDIQVVDGVDTSYTGDELVILRWYKF
jgi:prepilin-type N-terminal cleavage/methylation domain-containing protein